MATAGARGTGRRPPCRRATASLLHGEQLHLEDERRARRDEGARAALAVGDGGRADELRLAADLHLLDALRPAGDDAVQRERGRAAVLLGGVEHGPVDERALVVDLDRARRGGLLALPLDEALVDEAGGGLHGALLLRGLGG